MKYKNVYLITKNPGKHRSAERVFDKYKIELMMPQKDYIEIQASTSIEIARYTALHATKDLQAPVIREDHSLYINCLGLPGPYTSFIEKKLSAEKLLKIMSAEKDRTGYFEIATVYAEPLGLVKEFVCRVPIHIKEKEIVKDPRNGWNGILCLANEERAFTEYPEEERLDVWNKNFMNIAKFLSKS